MDKKKRDSKSVQTRTSKQKLLSTSSQTDKIKPFVCPKEDCRKPFSKKWNLQAHERLHTGSTPFPCRLGCGQSYMWMSSRKGHELNRCRFSKSDAQKEMISKIKSSRRSRLNKKEGKDQSREQKKSLNTKKEAEIGKKGKKDNRVTSHTEALPSKANREIISEDDFRSLQEKTYQRRLQHNYSKSNSKLLPDNVSECWSSVTEHVLDDKDIQEFEKCSWQDGDKILADISLPERSTFTEEFLGWLLPCKAAG